MSFTAAAQQTAGKLRMAKPGGQAWPVVLFSLMILGIFCFEIVNFSTSLIALKTIFGEASFAGVGLATILSIALCAVDISAISRLFHGDEKEREKTGFLFGGWLLAAIFNAMLTWLAVAVILMTDKPPITELMPGLNNIIPFFIAIVVWLVRMLLLGWANFPPVRKSTNPRPTMAVSQQTPPPGTKS